MIKVHTAFQLWDLRHYRQMILQRAAEVIISESGGDCPIPLKICSTGSASWGLKWRGFSWVAILNASCTATQPQHLCNAVIRGPQYLSDSADPYQPPASAVPWEKLITILSIRILIILSLGPLVWCLSLLLRYSQISTISLREFEAETRDLNSLGLFETRGIRQLIYTSSS